jgi:hypothetical protein
LALAPFVPLLEFFDPDSKRSFVVYGLSMGLYGSSKSGSGFGGSGAGGAAAGGASGAAVSVATTDADGAPVAGAAGGDTT